MEMRGREKMRNGKREGYSQNDGLDPPFSAA